MKVLEGYPPPGRHVIGAYDIAFNPKTKKTTVSVPRSVLAHYNGTLWVMNDPDEYPFSCGDCSVLDDIEWDPRNAVTATLTLINSFEYDGNGGYTGYDLRAIFLQNDTLESSDDFDYSSLEMITPTDCINFDYSLGYTPEDYDSPWANPFLAYDEDLTPLQRDFPEDTLQTIYFRMAVNQATHTESEIHSRIMIDVCYDPSNSPTAWPHCPEPYMIEFDPLSDSFPRILAGEARVIPFNVYDHACDDTPFPKDHYTYDEMEIDLDFYSHDDEFGWEWDNDGPESRQFYVAITPDADLPAGLYEGLLSVTDTHQAPNIPLSRKIWVSVTRDPDDSGDTYDDDLDDVKGISSPVMADINDDDDLETIFTVGGTVWALGQSSYQSGDHRDVHNHGFFLGTPTIIDSIDDDDCRDILVAWDPGGGIGNPEVRVLSGDDGGTIWEKDIDYAPVAHPVMVNLTNVCDGEEVLVLTEYYYYILKGAEEITGDRILTYGWGGPFTGAPAVLHEGNKTSEETVIFWISHKDDWYIEAMEYDHTPFPRLVELCEEHLECNVAAPSLPGTYSPTIGSYGIYPVIYAPTVDKVWMYRWYNDAFGWDTAIWLPQYHGNWGAQIALGDMNRDGYEDIVVPHMFGVTAYTGFTDPLDYSGQRIWSYSTLEDEITCHFNSPVLIDCNGDSFLDVISGVWMGSVPDPGYRLQILDGSPFNNHERPAPGQRGMWSWGGDLADGGLMVVGQSPVLTETTGGNLRIGMTLKSNVFPDPHAEGNAIYRSIDTEFPFHWDDVEGDDLYREPWLKSCFSLYNWNAWWNQSHPDYEE